MMDLRTHAWPTSAAVAGDDDVKMLLADLESGGGGGGQNASDTDDDGSAAHARHELALSLEADASTMVMMMLLPGVSEAAAATPATPATPAAMAAASLSEEEQQRELAGDAQESPDFNDDDDFDEELWTAAAHDEPFDLIDADEEPLALDDDAPPHGGHAALALAPFGELAASAGIGLAMTATTAGATATGAAGGDTKKRRGRKPSLKPKATPKKAKRPPPSPSKARLRNYERRSRTKRENTMLTMKDVVSSLETQIMSFCHKQNFTPSKQQAVCDMAVEAIQLNHQNYHLRKAIDDHKFFHSMIGLEYEHREATPIEKINEMITPTSWRPLDEEACFGFIRESYQEIENFSNSEDFVSSGLEICGWREKRKLCGKNVKFQFHKRFAKDCSEELATRSWEMRAVQDQVTRYFGPFLDVQVEVIQQIAADVVVVRRKITHTQDGWVHHTIYLLFRTKTPDGHLVCIRDMNPEDTRDMNAFVEAATGSSSLVIWSNCFIWWKFTTLPKTEEELDGFEVEYGGSLSSATSADAAFWMREVLLCALRWENLVIGPLLTF